MIMSIEVDVDGWMRMRHVITCALGETLGIASDNRRLFVIRVVPSGAHQRSFQLPTVLQQPPRTNSQVKSTSACTCLRSNDGHVLRENQTRFFIPKSTREAEKGVLQPSRRRHIPH